MSTYALEFSRLLVVSVFTIFTFLIRGFVLWPLRFVFLCISVLLFRLLRFCFISFLNQLYAARLIQKVSIQGGKEEERWR